MALHSFLRQASVPAVTRHGLPPWHSAFVTKTGTGRPKPVSRSMPRYFFHLAGSGARDIEGQEFADDEGARQEAVVVARELAGGRSISKNARIVVTDAKGKVIQKSR